MDQLTAYLYRLEHLSAEMDARAERVAAESREEEAHYRALAQASATAVFDLLHEVEQKQEGDQPQPAPVKPRRPAGDDDVDFADISWMNG
ncbi:MULTISPECIES: hypothetical protein [unclassified Crossiella]|uniref:hypothetical protein n=1 Tax=unclassified Crossiella TaxID=2620835 RepID=UPI002000294F|nr:MULTISPECIES: hypothetical protein [unclassified Crossiella]MCK2239749.1 hypothetical protein [Crossiella sp. S99.2]MCK2252444.1 hypothetical protein [Crossiella sp. S99.1]